MVEGKGYRLGYGSYFEMTCGLRSGLTLTRLPQDLDQSEQAETTRMLQVLNDFITTELKHCLRWLETSMLINYSGGFIQLLEKAEESLAIVQEAQKQSSTVPAFDTFQRHRTRVFRDYLYVLQLTAPSDYGEAEPPLIPAGFQTCPPALKMMEIGRRWEHLHRYDARTVPTEIAL